MGGWGVGFLGKKHYEGVRFNDILCQDWLIDVLRRGVASAAGAVGRQHYTGCVGRRTTRRVLVDTAGQSST